MGDRQGGFAAISADSERTRHPRDGIGHVCATGGLSVHCPLVAHITRAGIWACMPPEPTVTCWRPWAFHSIS